jgi:uncharacterized membrane protein
MAAPAPTPRSPLALAIFGLTLFGLLVVVQLVLKESGASVIGCSAESAGCADVTTGAYSDFLGLPNTVWGGLFYGLVAALRLAYGATGDDRLRLASLLVVVGGLLYTARLVYLQAVVIGTFCPLCMTSAGTVALLALLHVVEHVRARAALAPSASPS